MIQIILQILSIIGIIILVLLGLILLAAALILFVPIRYAVRAEREDKVSLAVKVHWLFHLLTLRFDYPESGAFRIKIAGITVYDSKKPKKPKKKKNKESEAEETPPSDEETNSEADTAHAETVAEENAEGKPEAEPEQEETAKRRKKKNIFRKIIDFFKKLKYTITHFYDTIKNVKENMEYYMTVLKEEQTLRLLRNGKTRLFKILKKIRPKKLEADIVFGTGSPDTTGYALGLYGMLLPYLGNHVNITPDFEAFVLRGRMYAKGRIRIITLIINALCILLDPNLKPVVKKLKREA